jgi:hypothetical protein
MRRAPMRRIGPDRGVSHRHAHQTGQSVGDTEASLLEWISEVSDPLAFLDVRSPLELEASIWNTH